MDIQTDGVSDACGQTSGSVPGCREPVLSRSLAECPWPELKNLRGRIWAPFGSELRPYGRHHVVALRLWRRLLARSQERLPPPLAAAVHRLASAVLPLWRLAPAHVRAEARAQHHGARDTRESREAARRAADTLLSVPRATYRSRSDKAVLLLTPSLASGGAERQLVLTARGLSEKGWSVDVAAKHLRHPPGCDALAGELGEIPVLAVSGAPPRHGVGAPDDVWRHALPPAFGALLEDLHALILQRRPQVVHAWMDEMSAVGGLAAALAGVPRIVLAGRNLAPHRFGVPQLGAIAGVMQRLARVSGVSLLNNSRAGAADYARWLGLPERDFRLLRNGFRPLENGDPGLWRPRLGIPAAAPVIGGLFRLAPEKRPRLWLEAASAVLRRRPDAHFVIFGDGPLKPALERRAAELGLSHRLHLPGTTPRREDAYAALDLFMLTSVFEGTPNVMLECQWLGLPVVTTAAGGVAEALAEAVPTPERPEALADAVVAALDGPRILHRGWIGHVFGLDRMIAETEALYLEEPSA